uniref:Uncharacterized protein n=1 Tax=Zea mays TaxID=4577 RepID=C0PKT8_MAIZE|nr:unknown [Zea mays]
MAQNALYPFIVAILLKSPYPFFESTHSQSQVKRNCNQALFLTL